MIEESKVDKTIAVKEPVRKPEVSDPSSSTGTADSVYNIYNKRGAVYASIQYTDLQTLSYNNSSRDNSVRVEAKGLETSGFQKTSNSSECSECKQKNSGLTESDLSNVTYPLCIRVPIIYKVKYDKLGSYKKHLFRAAVLGILDAITNNGRASQSAGGSTIVYNINVNVNSVEQQQTTNVKLDLKMIKDLLKEMDDMISKFYKLAYSDVERARYINLKRKISQLKQLMRMN